MEDSNLMWGDAEVSDKYLRHCIADADMCSREARATNLVEPGEYDKWVSRSKL